MHSVGWPCAMLCCVVLCVCYAWYTCVYGVCNAESVCKVRFCIILQSEVYLMHVRPIPPLTIRQSYAQIFIPSVSLVVFTCGVGTFRRIRSTIIIYSMPFAHSSVI